jgi:DNA-binding transcriptional ArsR family regulator
MKTNNEKILDALKEKESEISTTELAESTGINVKNISRYLKDLEKKGLIKRRTVQDGRKRFVYIDLTTGRNSDKMITGRNSDKMITGRNSDKMITGRKDQIKNKQKSKSLETKQSDKLSGRDPITGRNSDKMITGRNSDKMITGRNSDKMITGRNSDKMITGRNSDKMITGRNSDKTLNIRTPLTVSQIFEKVIEYTEGKQAKGYARINKILTSHDKNRNYQSHIIRDCLEILMEMGLIGGKRCEISEI